MLNSSHHSPQFFQNMWSTISSGQVWHGEIRNRNKEGFYYWVNATVVPFGTKEGQPHKYMCVSTDITQQKEMEISLLQAQRVAHLGSWHFNFVSNKLNWSDEVFAIFGVNSKPEVLSLEFFYSCIHPDDIKLVESAYKDSVQNKSSYDINHRIIRQDNKEVRWVNEKCEHQFSPDGLPILSTGTVQDITDQKKAKEELELLAMNDPLTALSNRNHFNLMFTQYCKIASRDGKKLAVMLLDLDKFKPVNDNYGHQIGDHVLAKVASRLKSICRKSDIVARLGGDEFAILMFQGNKKLQPLGERIISEIRKPIIFQDVIVKVGISIGVSIFPDDSTQQDELIKQADTALYRAKDGGRNLYISWQN